MNPKEILARVDHTALGACTTWPEIETLCKEAIRHQTASVCIPPSYVARAAAKYGSQLPICTVIGFPLGYNTAESKLQEAQQALKEGAVEIDMVVNLGDVKNGEFDKVTREIALLKQAAGDKILKVIVETCYLTQDEKVELCRCVTQGGADFIKTSTGFGSAGAQLEDIRLFRQHIGPDVKIKASGGIRTKQDLEAFAQAGCERIGASAAVKVLTNE